MQQGTRRLSHRTYAAHGSFRRVITIYGILGMTILQFMGINPVGVIFVSAPFENWWRQGHRSGGWFTLTFRVYWNQFLIALLFPGTEYRTYYISYTFLPLYSSSPLIYTTAYTIQAPAKMNFGTDEYNSETQELQGFSQDQWSTAMLDMDQGTRSRDSSTNLISPTSGSMDAVYGISGPSKDVNPSNYLYNTATASGSNSNTNSGSTSTTSFQNLFNNGNNMFPMDSSFDFMNNGFQDRKSTRTMRERTSLISSVTSNEYMKSAAAIQAAQNMFGSYALNNTAPTTAPPQALFQNNLQHVRPDLPKSRYGTNSTRYP